MTISMSMSMRVLRAGATLLCLVAAAHAFSAPARTRCPARVGVPRPSPQPRAGRTFLAATDDDASAPDAETAETVAAAVDFKSQWQVDDSYTTTDSGLMFKDVAVGSGESPDDGGTISLHYTMWFFAKDEGEREYFSTRTAKNPEGKLRGPMSLQYGEKAKILKGWLEGMQTMKPGGTRTLIVPPALGYGTGGLPGQGVFPAIPGGAHLKFEIELLEVDNSVFTKFRRFVPRPSAILE